MKNLAKLLNIEENEIKPLDLKLTNTLILHLNSLIKTIFHPEYLTKFENERDIHYYFYTFTSIIIEFIFKNNK